jgi:hypothetical protein
MAETRVIDRDFPAPIDFSDYEDDDEEQGSDVVPEFWHSSLEIVRPTLEQILAVQFPAEAEIQHGIYASSSPNVAFPRALVPGMTGWDVRGHKRAWSRAFPELYPWPTDGHHFTDYFGDIFKKAVIAGQKKMGILATGKIGTATHEKLERTHRKEHPNEWAFDALAVQLCYDFAKQYYKTPEQRIRDEMIAAWEYWCTLNSRISYEQERPFALVKPPQYSSRMDCSEYYTLGAFSANSKDPNGFGYNGYGYTGSIQANTAKITIYDLAEGDAVFYGFSASKPGFNYGDPTHIAGYGGIQYSPETGTHTRVVYTMGSDRDPRKRPMTYRHDVNEYAKLQVR